MKKFTKVAATVMAVAMFASVFAGCGASSADKQFFIGSTGPLTGDASAYGNSVKNGAQLAVDEINAAGGLNGYTFKFDMKDDKATAEDAATGYDALMDDGMQISIGSVTSGSCESFAAKSVNAVLFGCDGLDGVADQIDSTVKNSIKYITPFDVNSTEKATADFVSKYKAKYNESPDQFAADGYDAIYAIFEAMKAADVKDVNVKASDLCEAVKKAITADSFKLVGATGTMTWDASGACNKVPQIVEVQ